MAQILKRVSGTIKSAMQEMLARGKSERECWVTVGEALLEARGEFPNPFGFGVWIKAEGIDQIPGLASAASRSDCIWMAEFPLRAGLVPVAISNPRHVRAAWRKRLVAAAKDWVAAEVDFVTAVINVMSETYATEAEAEGAVGLAWGWQALPLPPGFTQGLLPPPAERLRRALVRAKKAGVVPPLVVEFAAAIWQQGFFSWALEPPAMTVAEPHPSWAPPAKADTPLKRFDHALRMALVEGVLPAEIDAHIPTVTYYNAEMAYERARAALELAKEQAFDLEEAKAMVKDVYLGDF